MIVLYVGTQLAASAVTAISADPTQRRIMFALPFVFVIFIINFPAGLIVYWITTNVWTIGQQLLVKKLYPKPEPLDPRDAVPEQKPARGKPATAAALTDGGSDAKAKPVAKRKAKAQTAGEGTAPRPVRRPGRPRRRPALRARRRSARGAGAEALTTMSVSEEPRPEELVAEAEGDSLGEAKWAAMKTLEARFPGLTADCVSFDVADDPGSDQPARVRARGRP